MNIPAYLIDKSATLSQAELKLLLFLHAYPASSLNDTDTADFITAIKANSDEDDSYDEDDFAYRYSLEELPDNGINAIVNACGFPDKSKYVLMQNIAKSINTRRTIFDYLRFAKGKIAYRFNPEYFAKLQERQSLIPLPDRLLQTFGNTGYSLKLYLLLKQLAQLHHQNEFEMSLEDASLYLCPDKPSYDPSLTAAAYANQKTVLDKAIAEINAVSDMTVSITGMHNGRKYVSWHCSVYYDDESATCWVTESGDPRIHDIITDSLGITVTPTEAFAIARCYVDLSEFQEAMHSIASDVAALRKVRILNEIDDNIADYIIRRSITYPHTHPMFWHQHHKAQMLLDEALRQGRIPAIRVCNIYDKINSYFEFVDTLNSEEFRNITDCTIPYYPPAKSSEVTEGEEEESYCVDLDDIFKFAKPNTR